MATTCAIKISIPDTGFLVAIVLEIAGCPERVIG
jgi:hypothetical protein